MKNPSLPFDQGRALARLQQFWHRNFGALVCALALAGLTAFALGDTLTFARGCGQLYDGVLRLHILANSDSEEDQALKLKVRDRVLQTAHELGLGEGCSDIDSLQAQVQRMLPELLDAANAIMQMVERHALRSFDCLINLMLLPELAALETEAAENVEKIFIRMGEDDLL